MRRACASASVRAALDGGLLQRGQLGLPALLFEGAVLLGLFLGAQPGLFFLLPPALLVDPTLLRRACTLLGLDLFLLLATLRVSQDLLDRDHHRGFLPLRHAGVFHVLPLGLAHERGTVATARAIAQPRDEQLARATP